MAGGQLRTKERGPDLWPAIGRDGKKDSSEAFYAFDDPLEAAVFSVLVEKMREMDEEGKEMDKTTNIIFIYSLDAVYC